MNDKRVLAILARFADVAFCLVETVLLVGWVWVAGRVLLSLR